MLSNAKEYVDNMARDWQAIKQKLDERRKGIVTDMRDIEVNHDRNIMYQDLVEHYYPKFNKLNDMENRIATVYFNTGYVSTNLLGYTSKNIITTEFPPLLLLDKGELKLFLKEWWREVQSGVTMEKLPTGKAGEAGMDSFIAQGIDWSQIEAKITKSVKRMCG